MINEDFKIGDLVQDTRNGRKAVVMGYAEYSKCKDILIVLVGDCQRLETLASNWVKISHYDQVEQIVKELRGV